MNIEKRVKIAKVIKIILFSIGPVMCLSALIAIAFESTDKIWGWLLILSLGIIFISVLLKDVLNLDNNIKLEHPEIYYGGPVYSVKLWSVSEDMIFTYDMNRFIDNAKFKFVDQCLVQRTYNPNYVREIISGVIIPVSEIYANATTSFKNIIDSRNPVCVIVNKSYLGSMSWPNCGEIAFLECGIDTVNQYIKERKDGYKAFETFEKYLEDIFSKGKEIYLNKEKEYNQIQQLVKK